MLDGTSVAAALDLVLGLLFDWFVASVDTADFLCLLLVPMCGAESAASSPDASREDGWSRSAVEDCLIEGWNVEVRFLFPDPEDDGEDIGKFEDKSDTDAGKVVSIRNSLCRSYSMFERYFISTSTVYSYRIIGHTGD